MTAQIPKTRSARKPVSKTLRFEVFKRDSFTCQYCGRTPPAVMLECDHIIPVFAGGGNDIDNLVAACFDCNRGKAARSLSAAPQSLSEKAKAIQEAELQLAGYTAIMAAKRDRVEDEAWQVVDELFGKTGCTNAQLLSIKRFVEKLGLHPVLSAADIARSAKPYSGGPQWRYFCGVCWNKIKDADNG